MNAWCPSENTAAAPSLAAIPPTAAPSVIVAHLLSRPCGAGETEVTRILQPKKLRFEQLPKMTGLRSGRWHRGLGTLSGPLSSPLLSLVRSMCHLLKSVSPYQLDGRAC